MQSKETLENEVRAIQRTVEKQLLLLQKSQETEKLLNGHIVCAIVATAESSLTAVGAREGPHGIEKCLDGSAETAGASHDRQVPARSEALTDTSFSGRC